MEAASIVKLIPTILLAWSAVIPAAYGHDSAPPTQGVCQPAEKCPTEKCPTEKCPAECCPKSDCCPAGTASQACNSSEIASTASPSAIAALVSDWLTKSPKFSAQLAIHFGTSDDPADKLGADAPSVEIAASGTRTPFGAAPQIAKPMRFQGIPRIQLGEIVGDVIACGHRICSGNKCYDVKDEPIAGTRCDASEPGVQDIAGGENEEILVVPMAPPAPPGHDIASYGFAGPESEASSILRSSGLQNVHVSIPVSTIVELLVAKTELGTRLEMAEHLMSEREQATVQFRSLSDQNARLSTQLAAAEARQQVSDVLTASLLERTELAMKLASIESRNGKVADASPSVQAIQEDLSNIRRQIAILRRSQPVPFAPSYVGIQTRPYVPTAQLPLLEQEPLSTEDIEKECGEEKTKK